MADKYYSYVLCNAVVITMSLYCIDFLSVYIRLYLCSIKLVLIHAKIATKIITYIGNNDKLLKKSWQYLRLGLSENLSSIKLVLIHAKIFNFQ